MSYAPQKLLDARKYLAQKTGLNLDALGIVGGPTHTYGYHLGKDRLKPGDYSNSLARDKSGLTDAASALDIGDYDGLKNLVTFMVQEARAGHLPDIRELIGPGSDGRAYSWTKDNAWTGARRSAGDGHEWHLHISYYRDSQNNDKTAPFVKFFEGTDDDMQLTDTVDVKDLDGNAKRITLEELWEGASTGAWKALRQGEQNARALADLTTKVTALETGGVNIDQLAEAVAAKLGPQLAAVINTDLAARIKEL